MASKPTTTLHLHSLFSLPVVVLLLLVGGADGDAVVGNRSRCAPVPSMTAEQACNAVSGTPHMLDLCLHTLSPPPLPTPTPVPVPVTRHASAAVRGALDAYAATVSAATSLLDGGLVPAAGDGDQRAAFGDCMVGYGSARVAMSRVADDLLRLAAGGGCDGGGDGDYRAAAAAAEEVKEGYTAGLRGMDGCARSMLRYPASPLYARNLADRNVTLLAALLCNLVPAPVPAPLPGLKIP